MRTLLVTQWFEPEPVPLPKAIAQSLTGDGDSVRVLTAQPNYPHGEIYPGYDGWRAMNDSVDGLPVLRTPVYPSHDKHPIGRIANYLSWALTSALGGRRAARWADIALVYSTPATAALGPWLWRKIHGTPYVVIVQDLWPDSVTESGMLPTRLVRFVAAPLRWFSTSTYVQAAHVIVISPSMTDTLTARGVDRERISLIYNWSPDESTAPPTLSRATAAEDLNLPTDAFVVTYAGNVGRAQGLETLVRAAEILREHPDVHILVAGDGVDLRSLRQRAQAAGLVNITFTGRLGRSEMGRVHAVTDVHLVSLIDAPLFSITMPSKVQSILAAGMPMIVMAPGDAAAVATESEAGWAVQPGDAQALASIIAHVSRLDPGDLAKRGRSARQYYDAHMSRATGTSRLRAILHQVTDRAKENPKR